MRRTLLTIILILSVSTIQAQSLWEVEAELTTNRVPKACLVGRGAKEEDKSQSRDTHLLIFPDSIEIFTPAGLTLWYREPMRVPFVIEYEAMVVQRDSTERLSDLNCFWLATDPEVPDGSPLTRIQERNGVFANASTLQLYYMGYGGNWNTTTRFRRYDGKPQPPLIKEYTDSAHLLRPNHWYRIRIEATPERTRYFIDDELLVDYADDKPLLYGWFGFRTTWSHCLLKHFRKLVQSTP